MPKREQLQEFVAWCGRHITGDEKGQARIFLDRLFVFDAFPWPQFADPNAPAAAAHPVTNR